jgi:vacuolar-type H+-ATPase subunit H
LLHQPRSTCARGASAGNACASGGRTDDAAPVHGGTSTAASAGVRTHSPTAAPSKLAALVDTEARLDRALDDARSAAATAVAAARRRAEASAASIDSELIHERIRIADEVVGATAAQIQAIAQNTRDQVSRYDAVRGDALGEIAHALAARLAALALDEGTP